MAEDRKSPTLEDFKEAIREIFGSLPIEAAYHWMHTAKKPEDEHKETIDGIGESYMNAAALMLNTQYLAEHLDRHLDVGGEAFLGAIILQGVSSAVSGVTYRGNSYLYCNAKGIAEATTRIHSDQFDLGYYSKITDESSVRQTKTIGFITKDAVKRVLGRKGVFWDEPPIR